MNPPTGPAGRWDAWARRWGALVIPVAVLLVYWPLSTFRYGLILGDTLDCWLPWRWSIASALQDGHFPLWNPYQQMGYPIYADLQGPAWYPEALALGGTVGHSLYVLQALFLAYVIIGGWGMMRLVRVLHADARVAVIAGLAYALGGFFTAHEMHVYAVISAAWLPWLLAAQVKLLRAPGWRPALEAAVVQFLGLTGGNHTFNLIGAYLLAALIAVHAVQAWRSGDRAYVKRLIGWETVFAGSTAVMACGTLYAWWEVAPHLARAGGMPYADAAAQPFTWPAVRSLLLPYAVGTDAHHLGTDPTMANGFMGVIMGLFAVLALLRRRSAVENTLAVFGVACALASFGDALPVHHWLWAALPGLDLFRFPSYYGLFTAIAVLVLAAGTLAQWEPLRNAWPRTVRALIVLAASVFVALIVQAWLGRTEEPSFAASTLITMGRMHRVLIEAPVTLLALAGMYAWVERGRWSWLFAAVALEMGWGTTLAQWNTALSDYSPAMLQGRIDELPRGPVWPELVPIGTNTDGSRLLKHIWRNVQDFQGRPTHEGFNSFWLKDANRLETDHTALWKAMERQPLIYLSDRVVPAEGYDPARVEAARDSALVVLPPGVAVPAGLWHGPADRVTVAGFHHDGITVDTRTAAPSFLLLQQAWYPGWHVTIDGLRMEVQRANIASFGAWLPPGDHRVEFRFSKPVVPWLLALSMITFLGALAALAGIGAPGTWRMLGLGGTTGLALALGWSLLGHSAKAERIRHEADRLLAPLAEKEGSLLLNTDRRPVLLPFLHGRTAVPVRADDPSRVDEVLRTVDAQGPGTLRWIDIGLPTAPAGRAALLDRYHLGAVEHVGDAWSVELLPGPDTASAGRELFAQHDQVLTGASPYTVAYRAPVRDLLAKGRGALVISLEHRSPGQPKAYVVIERKRGGTTTDYETVPLGPAAAGDLRRTYVVRNARELRHAEEELGIYVWSDSPDTLVVKDFRVRWTVRDLSKW